MNCEILANHDILLQPTSTTFSSFDRQVSFSYLNLTAQEAIPCFFHTRVWWQLRMGRIYCLQQNIFRRYYAWEAHNVYVIICRSLILGSPAMEGKKKLYRMIIWFIVRLFSRITKEYCGIDSDTQAADIMTHLIKKIDHCILTVCEAVIIDIKWVDITPFVRFCSIMWLCLELKLYCRVVMGWTGGWYRNHINFKILTD